MSKNLCPNCGEELIYVIEEDFLSDEKIYTDECWKCDYEKVLEEPKGGKQHGKKKNRSTGKDFNAE